MKEYESAEFAALAQLAAVDVAKLKAACEEPTNILEHLTLTDLKHLSEVAERQSAVQRLIGEALAKFSSYASGFIAARQMTESNSGN